MQTTYIPSVGVAQPGARCRGGPDKCRVGPARCRCDPAKCRGGQGLKFLPGIQWKLQKNILDKDYCCVFMARSGNLVG